LAEAYFLARRITTPLIALTQATRAFGEGETNVPLDVSGQDEFAVLAQSFATMRSRLSETYGDLAREKDKYQDFLAILPHEFKTPLAALAASLELLQTDFQQLPADQASALLESIHRSTIRLESLVDNLLDTASIQAGQFQVHAEPNPLPTIIESARVFVQPLLDQKQQTVQIKMNESLPWVRADPGRITQVLINLLSNASKYGPPGEPIGIEAIPVDSFIHVAVSDRGQGIAPEDQALLFQRFMRLAANGARAPEGLGFGLAIVKAIIDLHHGQVGVESEPGQGTTVWFTLPIAESSET